MAHVPSKTRKKVEWLFRRAEGALLPEAVQAREGAAPRLARGLEAPRRRAPRHHRARLRRALRRPRPRHRGRRRRGSQHLRRAARRGRRPSLPRRLGDAHLLHERRDVPPPREQRVPAGRGGEHPALRLRLGLAQLAARPRARLRRRARGLRRGRPLRGRRLVRRLPRALRSLRRREPRQGGDARAPRRARARRARPLLLRRADRHRLEGLRRLLVPRRGARGGARRLAPHVPVGQERLPRAGGRPRAARRRHHRPRLPRASRARPLPGPDVPPGARRAAHQRSRPLAYHAAPVPAGHHPVRGTRALLPQPREGEESRGDQLRPRRPRGADLGSSRTNRRDRTFPQGQARESPRPLRRAPNGRAGI